MADRRPRNTLPRLSDTLATLAQIQAVAHRLTPQYREAFDIASSKRQAGGVKVKGGDKSDPTGETASCHCEGSYHVCSPAQLRRAAQAIADAEESLLKAVAKVNSIFKHSEEKEAWDIPKRWRPPSTPPLIESEEYRQAKAAQEKREARESVSPQWKAQ